MTTTIIPELCARAKSKTDSIPILDYLNQTGRINERCTCCGGKMFTDDMLNELYSVRISPKTLGLTKVVDGHARGYKEPDKFKWLLCGLTTSSGVIFRTTCWDCFFKNLRERASDGKHLIPSNTKPNSWWMRVIRGEEAYPSGQASAIGRYWADLMFTTLTQEELKSLCHRFDTASKSSFIRRYGKEEGTRRYEEYVKFHSDKNKFEYKRDKFGWSKEQYDEFNKNRAVTLELCIKKHGEELGRKIFSEYCEKQAYAGCALEYFVEKYGEEEGNRIYRQVNGEKAISERKMIEKYGEEEGKARYDHWKELISRNSIKNLPNLPWSNVSQKLFDEILSHIPSHQYGKVRYATFGGEVCIHSERGYMFPDFLYDNKKIIEFNGDYWHRNPRLYAENDETALIWKQDAERKSELERLGYEVFVVWERDFYDNEDAVVQDCLKFLGYQ